MIKIILVVILSAVFSASGQMCFKRASNKTKPLQTNSAVEYLNYIGKVAKQPWVWLGLGSMGVSLVIWLIAVSQANLSLVYPIGSLYYIFVLALSHFFLGEKLDRMKLIGTFFILAGILLIVRN